MLIKKVEKQFICNSYTLRYYEKNAIDSYQKRNDHTNISPSFVMFIIITIIIYFILAIFLSLYDGKQDYIELLDNHLSICFYQYQKND